MSEATQRSQTEVQVLTRRFIEIINAVFSRVFDPYLYTALLLVAMVEAILSPFFGYRFALAAIACAAVAIGLILGLVVSGIEILRQGITSFHSDEMEKLKGAQQRPAPEQPMSPFKH